MDAQYGVIFDVDGTLIDSTYHHAIAWQRAFRECELNTPIWQVHRLIGMGGDKLVPELFGTQVDERLGDLLRRLHAKAYQELKPEVLPLPGSVQLVRHLSESGWRVTVASSGTGDDTQWAIDLLDLGDVFVEPTSGDDADSSKPDPDVISVALERLQVEHAFVVGDSVHDVRAAERSGCPCIAVRTGGFGREELGSAGAFVVADDLVQLCQAPWEDWAKHL
jgi:phosphoglycolate phosphatase-like HAD superfamily hydrolase